MFYLTSATPYAVCLYNRRSKHLCFSPTKWEPLQYVDSLSNICHIQYWSFLDSLLIGTFSNRHTYILIIIMGFCFTKFFFKIHIVHQFNLCILYKLSKLHNTQSDVSKFQNGGLPSNQDENEWDCMSVIDYCQFRVLQSLAYKCPIGNCL